MVARGSRSLDDCKASLTRSEFQAISGLVRHTREEGIAAEAWH